MTSLAEQLQQRMNAHFDNPSPESQNKPEIELSAAAELQRCMTESFGALKEQQEIVPETEGDKPDLTSKRAVGAFREGAKDTSRNLNTGLGILFQLPERLAEKTANSLSRMMGVSEEKIQETNEEFAKKPAITTRIGRHMQGAAKIDELKTNEKYLESSGFWEDVIRLGPQVFTQLGTVPGGAVVSGVTIGTQILGSTYEKLVDKGVDPDRAVNAGLANAIMQAPLEAIGVGKLAKFWKLKGTIVNKIKEIGAVAGTEWLTEFLQAHPEALTEIWATNPDKSSLEQLKTYWDNIGNTITQGAKEGLTTIPYSLLGAAPKALSSPSQQEASKPVKPDMSEESSDIFSNFDEEVKGAPVEVVEAKSFNAGTSKLQETTVKREVQEQAQLQNQIKRAAVERQKQIDAAKAEEFQQEQSQLKAQQQEVKRQQIDAQKAQEDAYAKVLSTPDGVLDMTSRFIRSLDQSQDKRHKAVVKPLRALHKALETGEQSLEKLKGLQYDLNEAVKGYSDFYMDTLKDRLNKLTESHKKATWDARKASEAEMRGKREVASSPKQTLPIIPDIKSEHATELSTNNPETPQVETSIQPQTEGTVEPQNQETLDETQDQAEMVKPPVEAEVVTQTEETVVQDNPENSVPFSWAKTDGLKPIDPDSHTQVTNVHKILTEQLKNSDMSSTKKAIEKRRLDSWIKSIRQNGAGALKTLKTTLQNESGHIEVRGKRNGSWLENQSDDTKSFLESVFPTRSKKKETFKSANFTWKDKIAEYWADELRQLKKVDEMTGAGVKESGYVAKRMLMNFPVMYDTFLHYGTPNYNKTDNWMTITPDKDAKGKRIGGLATVFKEVGKENHEAFSYRLAAKSIKELVGKGKENVLGKKDADAIVERILRETEGVYQENKEVWDKSEKRLQEINKSMLDFAQDAGMIDAEVRKAWERETYIPLTRVAEDFETGDTETMLQNFGGKNIKEIIKTLKGSDRGIGDPVDNLMNTYAFMMHESLRNVANKKSLNSLTGLDLAKKAVGKTGGDNVVKVYHKGKPQYWEVSDADLFNVVFDLNESTFGKFENVMKWLAMPKHLLTKAITIAPGFRVANSARDTVHTAFLEKGFVPIVSSLKGLSKSFSDDAIEMISTGGGFKGSYFSRDKGANIEKMKKNLKKELYGSNWKKIWHTWEKIGEVTENMSRVGIYLNEKGKGKSNLEAAFKSKDILDFHLSGRGTLAKTAIRLVPFLNARIQGLYKLGHSGWTKENRANFLGWSTVLAGLSLGLHAAYKDDDWYKDLKNHEKFQYMHIRTPEDGTVRIPLPFEIGALVGTSTVAFAESLPAMFKGKYPKPLNDWFWHTIQETFRLDVPQFVKPLLQQAMNKDTFRDTPIVSQYEQGLSEHEQWDIRTNKTARWIGSSMNKLDELLGDNIPDDLSSPKRIEQFIKDVTGFYGSVLMNAAEVPIAWMADYPEDPAVRIGDRYLTGVGRFYKGKDHTPSSIKAEEMYYELKAEVDEIYATFNFYKKWQLKDKLKTHRKKNIKQLRAHKIYTSAGEQISEINTKIKLAHLSKTKTAEQKRREIDALLKRRHKIIRKVLKRVQNRGDK